MKTEIWNDYPIRFVEIDGEWWAVASDVAKALGYRDAFNMARAIDSEDKGTQKVSTPSGIQDMVILSEFGIYDAILSSHKKEAKEFKQWVKQVIKELQQASGLEGFQVFRMLDKEHQKGEMTRLHKNLPEANQIDYIKANTIANKAVSTKYGYSKMVKKSSMTPEMLVDRQELLEDTVELMAVKEKYHLDISVSDEVYKLAEGQQVVAS